MQASAGPLTVARVAPQMTCRVSLPDVTRIVLEEWGGRNGVVGTAKLCDSASVLGMRIQPQQGPVA